jgi:DNA topoisomerase-3
VPELRCPRCGEGTLMTGKRGWGCTRWQAGCSFVIWFEIDGRRISEAELGQLVRRGYTDQTLRSDGRLVLDRRGLVRFEARAP